MFTGKHFVSDREVKPQLRELELEVVFQNLEHVLKQQTAHFSAQPPCLVLTDTRQRPEREKHSNKVTTKLLQGSVYVLPTCSAMTDDNNSQSHGIVNLSAGWYLDEKFS